MVNEQNIKRYGYEVILVHWLFIALLGLNLALSYFLFRDWGYHEFHIHGALILIPTPVWTAELHAYSGLGIFIVGLVHAFMHISQRERPLLSKDTNIEFKAMVHSFLYMVFMASREEAGSAGKYRDNQRMFYLCTIYTIGLMGITILIMLTGYLGELGLLMHIIAGLLLVFLVAMKFAYLIRKRDFVAIKCIMMTGKMPEWYVKKFHFRWYRNIQDRGSVYYRTECGNSEVNLNKESKDSKDNSTEVSI
ncbi:MAG: hypothetical protein KAJ33_03830 [Thermoplasmata archaeon]|nr:hypothetical protein [Thermoplasmata archaeon]